MSLLSSLLSPSCSSAFGDDVFTLLKSCYGVCGGTLLVARCVSVFYSLSGLPLLASLISMLLIILVRSLPLWWSWSCLSCTLLLFCVFFKFYLWCVYGVMSTDYLAFYCKSNVSICLDGFFTSYLFCIIRLFCPCCGGGNYYGVTETWG